MVCSSECSPEKIPQDRQKALFVPVSVLIVCGIILASVFCFVGFMAGLYTNMTGITDKVEKGCTAQCNSYIDTYCSCNPYGDVKGFNLTDVEI